ncbi:hypothetical protein [Rhodococcus koreensis]
MAGSEGAGRGNASPLPEEAKSTALRYGALHGTDHASHRKQSTLIYCFIIWRIK